MYIWDNIRFARLLYISPVNEEGFGSGEVPEIHLVRSHQDFSCWLICGETRYQVPT